VKSNDRRSNGNQLTFKARKNRNKNQSQSRPGTPSGLNPLHRHLGTPLNNTKL
jgi:hypothetical protein